ncbi:MAG: metal-dependent hydrolase [Candidatus Peregrinibacteria bacterium]|nr:metal-dependent hydrolase [Candidatus Peregrinibacteria bacterium]
MFVGHLPAGYVLTRALQKKLELRKYLLIGLIASVFPDTDIFYFYLVDNRQTLHHSYWIHIPFYWIVIALITFAFLWVLNRREHMLAAVVFFGNIFLHLMLDTIVGKIEWLFPFSEKAIYLFDVPAVHSFWVYNFIFHWTFLLEIVVILWALNLFFEDKRSLALEKIQSDEPTSLRS